MLIGRNASVIVVSTLSLAFLAASCAKEVTSKRVLPTQSPLNVGRLKQGCYVSNEGAGGLTVFAIKEDLSSRRYVATLGRCNHGRELGWTDYRELDRASNGLGSSLNGFSAEYLFKETTIEASCTDDEISKKLWESELQHLDWRHCDNYLKLSAEALSDHDRSRLEHFREAAIVSPTLKPNAPDERTGTSTGSPDRRISIRAKVAKIFAEVQAAAGISYDRKALARQLFARSREACRPGHQRAWAKEIENTFMTGIDDRVIDQVTAWIEPLAPLAGGKRKMSELPELAPVVDYYSNGREQRLPEDTSVAYFKFIDPNHPENSALGFYYTLPSDTLSYKKWFEGAELETCHSDYERVEVRGDIKVNGIETVFNRAFEHVFGTRNIVFVAEELKAEPASHMGTLVHELRHLLDDRVNPGKFDGKSVQAEQQRITRQMNRRFNVRASYRRTTSTKEYRSFIADLSELTCDKNPGYTKRQCDHSAREAYRTAFNKLLQKLPYYKTGHEKAAFREQARFLRQKMNLDHQEVAFTLLYQADFLIQKLRTGIDASRIRLKSGRVISLRYPVPDYFDRYLDEID